VTGIASGVTGMLLGQQPPAPTSSSTSLWVVYGVVVGIILLQVGGIARSVRTIRGWRATPSQRPTGALQIGLRVGLPLLVNWSWALIVLVGLPRIISAPLPAALMGLPDLGYLLVASAVLASGWGLARVIWAIRTLRTPAPGVRGASDGAT
jgi:ABC-type amino acid transport system permease subunit